MLKPKALSQPDFFETGLFLFWAHKDRQNFQTGDIFF